MDRIKKFHNFTCTAKKNALVSFCCEILPGGMSGFFFTWNLNRYFMSALDYTPSDKLYFIAWLSSFSLILQYLIVEMYVVDKVTNVVLKWQKVAMPTNTSWSKKVEHLNRASVSAIYFFVCFLSCSHPILFGMKVHIIFFYFALFFFCASLISFCYPFLLF